LELEAQGPDAEEAITALAQAVRPGAMETVTNLDQ
jgi:hypothetical protein